MSFSKLGLSAAACLLLEACSNQYWERKDGIAFSAGDAVATNSAVQIPDPWPRRSNDTNIPMDPYKAENAMYNYRVRRETITTVDGNGNTSNQSSNTPGLIGKTNVNVNQSVGGQ